jgi:hypothetical protein
MTNQGQSKPYVRVEGFQSLDGDMSEPRVFFDVVLSLDGFIAPEGMEMAHADDPS